jgi:hypothetical protein
MATESTSVKATKAVVRPQKGNRLNKRPSKTVTSAPKLQRTKVTNMIDSADCRKVGTQTAAMARIIRGIPRYLTRTGHWAQNRSDEVNERNGGVTPVENAGSKSVRPPLHKVPPHSHPQRSYDRSVWRCRLLSPPVQMRLTRGPLRRTDDRR